MGISARASDRSGNMGGSLCVFALLVNYGYCFYPTPVHHEVAAYNKLALVTDMREFHVSGHIGPALVYPDVGYGYGHHAPVYAQPQVYHGPLDYRPHQTLYAPDHHTQAYYAPVQHHQPQVVHGYAPVEHYQPKFEVHHQPQVQYVSSHDVYPSDHRRGRGYSTPVDHKPQVVYKEPSHHDVRSHEQHYQHSALHGIHQPSVHFSPSSHHGFDYNQLTDSHVNRKDSSVEYQLLEDLLDDDHKYKSSKPDRHPSKSYSDIDEEFVKEEVHDAPAHPHGYPYDSHHGQAVFGHHNGLVEAHYPAGGHYPNQFEHHEPVHGRVP